MDIRPAIRSALLSDPLVAAIVDARIYPAVAPQGERRALIVLHRVSEVSEPTLKGESGLHVSRVQVDAWGATLDDASALAEAVRGRLHGLAGLWAGIVLTGAFAGSIREGQDRETGAWRVGRDYMVYARAG